MTLQKMENSKEERQGNLEVTKKYQAADTSQFLAEKRKRKRGNTTTIAKPSCDDKRDRNSRDE